MTNATDKLSQIMGKSKDEVNGLITAALADPSSGLLDALLERFVYLKLSKQEELDKHKEMLVALHEQGRHFHLTRQLSKLTSR